MRDIREIIDDLLNHPDYVSSEITTINDIIESFNDDDVEVEYDDLSGEDWGYIIAAMDIQLPSIRFPKWQELPDLSIKILKKIERDTKISEILKNKNEI